MHAPGNARHTHHGKHAALTPLFVTLVSWLALLLIVQAPLHRLHMLGALAPAGAPHAAFPQGGPHPTGPHARHQPHERGQHAGNPGHERKHTLRDCVCCAPSLFDLPPAVALAPYGADTAARVERTAGGGRGESSRPTARGPPSLLG